MFQGPQNEQQFSCLIDWGDFKTMIFLCAHVRFPCLNLTLTIDGYMILLMGLSGSFAKSLYTALWTMNVMRTMTLLTMEKMIEATNPDWLS